MREVAQRMDDLIKNGTDAEKLKDDSEKMLFECIGRRELTDYNSIDHIMVNELTVIDNRIKGDTGLKTGLQSLDEKIVGLQPGKIIVIAARPSMGKSALGATIIRNIAMDGHTAGIFSFEMMGESIAERYFSNEADVDHWKMQTGKLSDDEISRIYKCMDNLGKLKILIDDNGGCDIEKLCQKIILMKRRSHISTVMIDHISYIRSKTGENRNLQVEFIMERLRETAKRLCIPIILLTQLSRTLENRTRKNLYYRI